MLSVRGFNLQDVKVPYAEVRMAANRSGIFSSYHAQSLLYTSPLRDVLSMHEICHESHVIPKSYRWCLYTESCAILVQYKYI
jgi:hypothetical protein